MHLCFDDVFSLTLSRLRLERPVRWVARAAEKASQAGDQGCAAAKLLRMGVSKSAGLCLSDSLRVFGTDQCRTQMACLVCCMRAFGLGCVFDVSVCWVPCECEEWKEQVNVNQAQDMFQVILLPSKLGSCSTD